MHPVIQNILNRKNKNVPINDGRKISLVLFGGAMVAARNAGALVALEELGLTGAFNEVYGMSSGLINGSYFISGQGKECASIYYENLTGNKFINWFRFWKMVDINYLLHVIEKIKILKVGKILESKTKLYSILINATLGEKIEYVEAHNYPAGEFSAFLKASTSLPYATRSIVRLGEYDYHDIFHNKSLVDFVQHVIDSDATDILILYNYPWQETYVRKSLVGWDDSRIYGIMPPIKKDIFGVLEKFRRFETDGKTLKQDCQATGNKVKKIFVSPAPIKLI
jgi:predicted patatin/cPLA2 family phospholipase